MAFHGKIAVNLDWVIFLLTVKSYCHGKDILNVLGTKPNLKQTNKHRMKHTHKICFQKKYHFFFFFGYRVGEAQISSYTADLGVTLYIFTKPSMVCGNNI